QNRNAELLARKPMTEYEAQLQAALLRSNNQLNLQNEWMMSMQAQNVLQDWYAREVRGQLEYKEEKASTKKSARLHVDGRAKLLTSNEFTSLVEQANTKKAEETAELARKRDARVTANQRLATAMIRYDAEVKGIEEKNEQTLKEWEASVQEWEKERDIARTERRKPAWTKPSKPTYTSGALVKPPAKPK
ncbi:hypothetical protein C8R41DRAFT_738750, partial [Lentinula lateritia]